MSCCSNGKRARMRAVPSHPEMIPLPVAQWQSICTVAKGILCSTRALGSVIAGIIVTILANDVGYGVISTAFFLFSYIFNDICDWEKDRIAHPERPIASGLLPRHIAAAVAVILFLGGVGLAWLVARPMAVFFGLLYPASVLYSALLKRTIPAFATPWWCLLGASVFLLPIRPSALQFTSVFAFFLAREILLDFRDRRADDQFCLTRSIPILLGRHTFGLVCALQLVSFGATVVLGNRLLLVGNAIVTVAVVYLTWLSYAHAPWRREGRDDFGALRFVKRLMWVGFVMAAAF